MNWTIFIQLVIAGLLVFLLGYYLLRYLNGDLTVKEQKLIKTKIIYNGYRMGEPIQIGELFIYEIIYESGKKKIKTVRVVA